MIGRTIVVGMLLGLGCGDNHETRDAGAPDGPDVPAITPECHDIPPPSSEPFMTAAELGPLMPGTLAGWNPDGRWFLTGVRVGSVSSYHFERRGAEVIVDRAPADPGTMDDDALFQRTTVTVLGVPYRVVTRISNRAADGSLRAERAVCEPDTCRVCTARLIRATRNEGEVENDKLALAGELLGTSWRPGLSLNVRVAGTLAYLLRRDGLYIIDTADPAHPVELGHYRRSDAVSPNDVKIVDAGAKRYALIADSPVDVVDVTNPAAPQLAAQIPAAAHTLAVETRGPKTYAYLGSYDASCPIYDVTDPALPVLLGKFQTKGKLVHDLAVEAGIAYLNAWDAGFQVVDYTTPSAPQLLGTWAPTPAGTSHSSWTLWAGGRHIALHGDENYGAHLDLVDVDPASSTFMQPFASYKTRDHVSIHNVMAVGTKAYFAYYQDGVRVLDLANPTAPELVGYFNTWDPQGESSSSAFFEGAVGIDVDPSRKLVFIADSPRGLLVLRDMTPD